MPDKLSTISIDDITLERGSHETGEEGRCFMEAVAFVAGEDHSDLPACVCPALGEFARRWNDHLGEIDRQKMKPYIRLVIGTAGDGFGERRSWMMIDWCLREGLAVYCDARNLKDIARELKGLPEICDFDAAKRARDVLLDLALALARDLDLARALARARGRKTVKDSGFALLDRMVMLGAQIETQTTEGTREDARQTLNH